MAKDELKSVIAENKPRDSHGHFIHIEKPGTPQKPQDPISKFMKEHTSYSKNQDDLLDIHVGNPLRKIVELLQEIKQQKAFSFTLKGSLGIAGVALTLGVFGVFGGGQILCERGVQSQIGTVKILNATDNPPQNILKSLINNFKSPEVHNRVVLVKNDYSVVSLILNNSSLIIPYTDMPVIATGNYNSCSQTLSITDNKDIQIFAK